MMAMQQKTPSPKPSPKVHDHPLEVGSPGRSDKSSPRLYKHSTKHLYAQAERAAEEEKNKDKKREAKAIQTYIKEG